MLLPVSSVTQLTTSILKTSPHWSHRLSHHHLLMMIPWRFSITMRHLASNGRLYVISLIIRASGVETSFYISGNPFDVVLSLSTPQLLLCRLCPPVMCWWNALITQDPHSSYSCYTVYTLVTSNQSANAPAAPTPQEDPSRALGSVCFPLRAAPFTQLHGGWRTTPRWLGRCVLHFRLTFPRASLLTVDATKLNAGLMFSFQRRIIVSL